MAPKLINNSNIETVQENLNFREINKKLREYKEFIKKNFDDVGEIFAYEARSIHYDKKRKKVYMEMHQKMKLKN